MSAGIGAALFWALETILLNTALSAGLLKLAGSIYASLIGAAFHDLCSACCLFLYLTRKGQRRTILPSLRSSGGRKVMLAALLGGPVGMSCYLLAIQTAGASVAASISALYPAVGAFLSALFLRERLRLSQKGGLLLSVSGGVLLGSLGEFSVSHWLGLVPAALCALCWGAEAPVSSSGMQESDISAELALQIRQLTSAVVYWGLLLPVSGAWRSLILGLGTASVRWLPLAALAGTASYLCYYSAIRKLGPSKAMALNITYTVWVVLLAALLTRTPPGILSVFCAGLISLGSALTAREPAPNQSSKGEMS